MCYIALISYREANVSEIRLFANSCVKIYIWQGTFFQILVKKKHERKSVMTLFGFTIFISDRILTHKSKQSYGERFPMPIRKTNSAAEISSWSSGYFTDYVNSRGWEHIAYCRFGFLQSEQEAFYHYILSYAVWFTKIDLVQVCLFTFYFFRMR